MRVRLCVRMRFANTLNDNFQGQRYMSFLAGILLCVLVSIPSAGRAAQAPTAVPAVLQAVSRTLLEENSLSQRAILEQIAEQYRNDGPLGNRVFFQQCSADLKRQH